MSWNAGLTGRIGIKGTLEYRRADGSIIKTVDIAGSVPIGAQDVVTDAAKVDSVQGHPQDVVPAPQEPSLAVFWPFPAASTVGMPHGADNC